jgi:hypothetical protein
MNAESDNPVQVLKRALKRTIKGGALMMYTGGVKLNQRLTAWRLKLPIRGKTALMAAAVDDDCESIESLLVQGVAADARDGAGRTALHYAVGSGRANAAACLLANGADYSIGNNRGARPVSLEYTDIRTLHAIRQRQRRYRYPVNPDHSPHSRRALTAARELDENGVARVTGLIGAQELEQLQADFRDFIDNIDNKVRNGEGLYKGYFEEEHLWRGDLCYVTNNAFKYSKQLVRLCCDPELLDIATAYYGRPPFITRGVGMRYLPGGKNEYNMFRWHHDKEDRRLKMQILLTDVAESDQHMSYVLGSHRIYHPYRMFFGNECSLEYTEKCLGRIDIFKATGKAGDVILFDSNGTHRGNRKADARVRDVFFVEFNTDNSDNWGGDIAQDAFEGFPLQRYNPFEQMLATRLKMWERPDNARIVSTWIDNLPHVERWL